ncbi:MAG TPA: hypothetical protein VGN69_03365 [Solirubrobacteraceae bacterium]|jgi:hypothetical protein|nr:hypothetical protein [Solirubrobacteraceae bacterium]
MLRRTLILSGVIGAAALTPSLAGAQAPPCSAAGPYYCLPTPVPVPVPGQTLNVSGITVYSHTVRPNRRFIPVVLHCAANHFGPCTGRVEIDVTQGGKTVALAIGSYSLAPNQTMTVYVRKSARGASRLRHSRRRVLRARVSTITFNNAHRTVKTIVGHINVRTH